MLKQPKDIRPTTLVIVIISIAFFTSIVTTVIAISKIENYCSPYLFGLSFGSIGILFGTIISLKLKSIIAVNQRLINNYFPTVIIISIAFFGPTLLLSSMINESSSTLSNCQDYEVINKYRQEYSYGSPEINSLVVNLNNQPRRIVCSMTYWRRTTIAQSIHLCSYKGIFGFERIEVVNDHYRN